MFPMPTLLGWVNLSGSESCSFVLLCSGVARVGRDGLETDCVAPGYVLEMTLPLHTPLIILPP
jgi:hypothetical protein